MKAQQKVLICILLVFIVVLLNFLYIYYLHSQAEAELVYKKNISQLYTSFTDYMRNEVDAGLSFLSCEPQEYYFDGVNICFVCNDIHPCFGYGWTVRGLEKARNPRGAYVSGAEKLDVKIVDFCEDGLASELNCQNTNEGFVDCEKISVLGINRDGVFKCEEIRLILKEWVEPKDFANYFCSLKEEELVKITEPLAFCGKYLIVFERNRQITIIDQ